METFETEIDYIIRMLGIKLDKDQINAAAVKMGLKPVESSEPESKVKFEVNPVRPDILHPCDLAEEVGIGYGFNNIPKLYPPTNTVGSFIPENKFTDLLRHELA
jgi:phenylalanyl-tRNA synthetase beta chain